MTGKIIEIKKRFNHRWKQNPLFIRGFDYDDPKYAAVPDDLKWALPIHEATSTAEYKAVSARMNAEAKKQVAMEIRRKRIKSVAKASI